MTLTARVEAEATNAQRRGVIVLGMHRSGTSASTRIVNLAGIPLAENSDLWLSLPGNRTGYWESSSLSRFNESLLNRAGGAWWRPPPEHATDSLASDAALVQRAGALFARLHGTPQWVWKDPRICLLLPFWRTVLGSRLQIVLVMRHPYEVAESLAARDSMPWDWSLALWETYHRRALSGLVGLPVHALRFADLVTDTDVTVDGVIRFLSAGSPNGEGMPSSPVVRPDPAAVSAFLDPELRHSSYEAADLLAAGDDHLLALQRLLDSVAGDHVAFPALDLGPTSPRTGAVIRALHLEHARHTLPEAVAAARTEHPQEEIAVTAEQYAPSSSTLAPEWQTWLATNLMLGVDDSAISDVLVRAGFDLDTASREIELVRADPCLQAGRRITQQLKKLESLLDVRTRLAQLVAANRAVPRHPVITREQFLIRYYAENKPVLIEGLVDGWPALTRWSPAYLAATVPDVQVEVMVDRANDPKYEMNSQNHKATMSMISYIRACEVAGASNDIYMVANNHFLENPAVASLWDDIVVPAVYLEPTACNGNTFFWFGPRGTITPLHHDVQNVLFVQVYGSKRITLIPSLQTHDVYNETAVYSSVDAINPDLQSYPRFARTTPMQVTVGPGEALFIPVGWWHCVEALDTSISVSFTNFAFPNAFEWQHPGLEP